MHRLYNRRGWWCDRDVHVTRDQWRIKIHALNICLVVTHKLLLHKHKTRNVFLSLPSSWVLMIQNPLKLRRCLNCSRTRREGFLLKRRNVPLKVATPSHRTVLEVKKRLGRVRFSSFFADTESEKRRSSQTVRGNMTSSFAIQMRWEPLLWFVSSCSFPPSLYRSYIFWWRVVMEFSTDLSRFSCFGHGPAWVRFFSTDLGRADQSNFFFFFYHF